MLSPIEVYLKELHDKFLPVDSGEVATYIPELAKANHDWFGICLVTATGSVYEVGDSRIPFTVQSISKPFAYGLALEDQGRPTVLKKVGLEPTGDAFNSISLDPSTGRPRNPMINAGAISTCGMVMGKSPEQRFQRILDTLSCYAGRDLEMDESVYQSESQSGHRNRAIGHMLRNFDILEEDPTSVVDYYFKQCSISVTCRDLAVMAATLANRGVNPLTHRQALRGEYVESVLSVMGSCGMYDYAGSWIYHIGMPAKSGVSGGIIAVLPGQMGIGVFSPPLDDKGNSVRGIQVCDQLSRQLDLHLFNRPSIASSVIRSCYTGSEISSRKSRSAEEAAIIREAGNLIRVYQLQGSLDFITTEVLVNEVRTIDEEVKYLILDLRRVMTMNESSCLLLHQLLLVLRDAGTTVLFTRAARFPILRRIMRAKLKDQFEQLYHAFEGNDEAMEWCENRVLDEALPGRLKSPEASLTDIDLLAGLNEEQLATIEKLLEQRVFPKGGVVVRAGDPADHLYLVVRGGASVVLDSPNGSAKRLASFSAGMAFGEMAIMDGAPRSANVVAESELVCYLLKVEDLRGLAETSPAISIKLLENISLSLSNKLRRTNRELSVFE